MPRKSAANLSLIRPGIDPAPSRLQPPRDLAADERRLFLELVNATRPQHFLPSDRPLLVRYVEAACLAARASRELKTLGVVGPEGVNPWLAVRSRATREMAVLSTRLRLSPQSRLNQRAASKHFLPPSFYDRQRDVEEEPESEPDA